MEHKPSKFPGYSPYKHSFQQSQREAQCWSTHGRHAEIHHTCGKLSLTFCTRNGSSTNIFLTRIFKNCRILRALEKSLKSFFFQLQPPCASEIFKEFWIFKYTKKFKHLLKFNQFILKLGFGIHIILLFVKDKRTCILMRYAC